MPIISNFPSGGSGGGGGLALAAVTGITTLVSHGKVYVKWTDPDDLVVAGSTLAEWSGTILVRKAGSTPTSRRDGTIVLDSKTRNAYQSTYFCDSGLTDGTTYYYKFFPYTTTNTYTDDTADEFNETPEAIAPGNVSGMSTVASGNGKLGIKWTDPASTVVSDGVTIATWGSTKVVVKAGSYATDPDDEDAAWSFNSTTRNAYANTNLVATGLTNGTTYYVSFFPMSTDGGVNVDASNRITGTANRMTISTVPSQSGTLTYDGSTQYPSWSNYDSTKMSKSETGQINAGTYTTVSFTPLDDYMWSDGTITAKRPSWTIGQATGSLTVSETAITLNKTSTSATFTIGGNYDGTLVVESSDTNIATVSRNGSTVTVNSVNNTSGSATITVSIQSGTNSNYTLPSNKTVSVTAKFVTIYGVTWDGTSTTALTRTDAAVGFTDPVPAVSNGSGSSPFDDLMPWSGMVRVTDSVAGELVAIPKFWYKLTQSGNTLSIQIADGEVDGYSVSPAHMDRGDGSGERDLVYIGRYHCATSTYKSTSGVKPAASVTRANARTNIHNLGSNIWQADFAMRFTIWLLYIVEFANWNSQAKIGYGCGNNSATENMGYTDSMTYHTGTKQSSRTTYGLGTQYRYIEGLWDNVLDWMDGCYNASSGTYIILNPSKFSDTGNGTLMGKPGNNGYISKVTVSSAGGFPAFYNSSSSAGSDSTYIPDYWSFNTSYPCLFVGGSYSRYQSRGLFFVNYYSTSNTNADIGCRLMKLP